MALKNTLGKTTKYSGLAKSVKGSQTPVEPRITADQVIRAFQSFGFQPNERNHNDLGYWTLRPQSDGAKLMDELHKRRMDINKKEDEEKKSQEDKQKTEQDFQHKQEMAHKELIHQQTVDKTAMPRLSDEDINALFDEYGLPAQDPEWIRNHLPNDPKKIRSILEMQRKTADDLLKKHSKNSVNAIPETPKMSAQPAMPTQPQPMMGMGGPSPLGMQGGMTQEETPPTPFFVGDHALVKITSPQNPSSGTLWLVDKKLKVLRPITSENDLQNMFEDPNAAMNSIVTLSSQALGPNGPLAGFTPLGADKGIQQDGSMPNIEFSPDQLSRRYGKPQDIAEENRSIAILDGLLGHLNSQQTPQ